MRHCDVSDASGQMNSEQTPSGELYAVPLRSNSILMSRVREAELRELSLLQRSSAISGLMFLHLKKGLDMKQVDWIGADSSNAASNAGERPKAAAPDILWNTKIGAGTPGRVTHRSGLIF